MIVRIVKLTLDPLQVDRFLEVFDGVKEQIRSFEGCSHTEMLTDVSKSGIVFTYSHWDTIAALENYRDSELFQSTWAVVKPMFIAKAEAWTLEQYIR